MLKFLGCLIIVVISIYLILDFSAYIRGPRQERGDHPSILRQVEDFASRSQKEGQPEITKSFIISPQALLTEYKNNEISADNRYKGRFLSVTGIVGSISKDYLDTPYLIITAGTDFDGIHCSFTKNDEPQLERINKGEKVTVIGRCDGLILGSVFLKNCQLQKSTSPDANDDLQPPASVLGPPPIEGKHFSESSEDRPTYPIDFNRKLPHAMEGGNISTHPMLIYSDENINVYIPDGMIDAIKNLHPLSPNKNLPITSSFLAEIYFWPKTEKSRINFKGIITDIAKKNQIPLSINEIGYVSQTVGFNREKQEQMIFNLKVFDDKENIIFSSKKEEKLKLEGIYAKTADNIASILEREK